MFLFAIFLMYSCNNTVASEYQKVSTEIINKVFEQLQFSLKVANQTENNSKVFPRSLKPSGDIYFVDKRDWTSGLKTR